MKFKKKSAKRGEHFPLRVKSVNILFFRYDLRCYQIRLSGIKAQVKIWGMRDTVWLICLETFVRQLREEGWRQLDRGPFRRRQVRLSSLVSTTASSCSVRRSPASSRASGSTPSRTWREEEGRPRYHLAPDLLQPWGHLPYWTPPTSSQSTATRTSPPATSAPRLWRATPDRASSASSVGWTFTRSVRTR